jgi:mono/diheme cytochrome c family protein
MANGMMRKTLRWAGFSVAGLLVIILIIGGVVYAGSSRIINKKYELPAARPLYDPADSATLAWGQHLAHVVAACADCHGQKFEGQKFFDAPPFGKLYAPNLTTGKGGMGVGTSYDIATFERAVRHGVRKSDGTSLWIMPSFHFDYICDEDIAAIYAYLKTVPPVDQPQPDRMLGPVGRMLLFQGKLPLQVATIINHDHQAPPKPKAGPTAQYGEYLAHVSCVGCHGPNLSGGPIIGGDPNWPPAANLTKGGIGATYSEKDFFTALREGKRPGGGELSPVMPWKTYTNLTDEEIHALWAYLQSVPAAAYSSGNWLAERTP